jgi:hypothetical protein
MQSNLPQHSTAAIYPFSKGSCLLAMALAHSKKRVISFSGNLLGSCPALRSISSQSRRTAVALSQALTSDSRRVLDKPQAALGEPPRHSTATPGADWTRWIDILHNVSPRKHSRFTGQILFYRLDPACNDCPPRWRCGGHRARS